MPTPITRGAALVLALGLATPALAEGYIPRRGGTADGYVVAHSRIGNASVSGPVRTTPLGRQVRLPSGRWEYCKRSCAETLRVETIDYWYARDIGGFARECGVFGCLEVRYPR